MPGRVTHGKVQHLMCAEMIAVEGLIFKDRITRVDTLSRKNLTQQRAIPRSQRHRKHPIPELRTNWQHPVRIVPPLRRDRVSRSPHQHQRQSAVQIVDADPAQHCVFCLTATTGGVSRKPNTIFLSMGWCSPCQNLLSSLACSDSGRLSQ
jgi:hypothetical protein